MEAIAPARSLSYEEWREQYGARLRELSEAATQRKLSRGEAVGKLPPGYFYDWSGGTAAVAVDTGKAPLIAEAFRKAGGTDMSLRALLPQVQAMGLTSREGTPISLATLYRVLTNPFYCGTITYRGKPYGGRHQALVSKSLFRRVQANLKRRSCVK